MTAVIGILGFLFSESASAKEKAVRSFEPVRKRIEALKDVENTVLGKVGGLPVYALTTPAGPNQKKVLLSGGVHGDEPAGVFALLEFLEKKAPAYAGKFRFYVFPCVNPTGFEKDIINGSTDLNTNRMFKKDTPSPEAKLILEQIAKWDTKFDFAMDMHEVPPYWADEGFTAKDNPLDAYLYETHADKSKRIGRKMIDGLPKDITVCQWPKIYGDTAERGLVTYPEGNQNTVYAEQTTLDGYLQGRYSPHTFTNETPIGWPLEKRVRAQLSWLETALSHYSK